MKTHTDGIWISEPREQQTVKQLTEHILSCGYSVVTQNSDNFGFPYEFIKGDTKLNCRLVDKVDYTQLNKLKVSELREICIKKSLSVSGNKLTLIKRINDNK